MTGWEQPGAQIEGEMSSRSAHRGRRTRALKGPRLGGTLTCELPVSSTFCLQIGKVRMHQKSGIIAPYTGICHSCFQCFEYFFLCHMKNTQVCKAGGNSNNNQKLGRQRLESCFTLTKRIEKTGTDPQSHYHQLHARSGWVLPPNQAVVNSEKSSGFQSLLDLQIMIQGVGYTYLNKKVSPRLILKYFLGELYKRQF